MAIAPRLVLDVNTTCTRGHNTIGFLLPSHLRLRVPAHRLGFAASCGRIYVLLPILPNNCPRREQPRPVRRRVAVHLISPILGAREANDAPPRLFGATPSFRRGDSTIRNPDPRYRTHLGCCGAALAESTGWPTQ
jgi:hypothetical protein